MNRKWTSVLFCLVAMIVIAAFGCSNETTSPTGDNNSNEGFEAIDFAGFTELVEQIAPPVYTAEGPLLSGQYDSMWTNGDYPLLGKVFSETEPMSLYTNIANLDIYLEELADIYSELDSMDIENDTIEGPDPGEDFSVEIQTLTVSTSIPTQCQAILGFSSVDLETLIKMESVEGGSPRTMHGGFTVTDSIQKIMVYHYSSNGTLTESALFYAIANLADSVIDIRGVFFKDYGNETSARWGYTINTVNESDFAYRMSWFSDESPEFSLLGCIIGGGNKDEQFALKYRQYVPADTNVVDSVFILDQTFDSNYDYVGTGIAVGYESFVVESDIFTIDAMPTALLTSPWAE